MSGQFGFEVCAEKGLNALYGRAKGSFLHKKKAVGV
jgi:hypothetical protein